MNSQRRDARLLCCAVIFLSTFVSCALGWEYRLAPDKLGFKINLDLQPFWDGVLNVKQIDLDPCGTVTIHELSITDRGGRQWLEVASAKLQFATAANVPVKLISMQIDRPHVTLWLDANGLSLPKGTKHYSTDEFLDYLDLRRAAVSNGTLSIVAADATHTWKNIHLAATRSSDAPAYDVQLAVVDDANVINVSGDVNLATRRIYLKCRATYFADANETAGLAHLFEIPLIHHAVGKIDADLDVSGSLDEGFFSPIGSANLHNVSLFTEYGCIANALESKIIFFDRRILFETIEGQAADGFLKGKGTIIMEPNETDLFAGKFSLEGANLTQLSAALGNATLFRQGTISAVYAFTCQPGRIESLKAHGLLFLDDADLWKVPVISHLFKYLSFASTNPLTFSDVAVHYTMKGPVIIIDKAQLTSPLVAVEFEKGSTLNLESHWANGYANVIFIQKLGNLIAKIPFIQPFINLKNKLTRVEIRGNWRQPGKLVRKNVGGDITAGTIGFFRDAAKEGGQLNQSVVNSFTSLFQKTEKKL